MIYNNLIPEEQVTCKRILLRLVRPGEGLEVTSNRVRRQSLYGAGKARADRVDRVLDKLIAARLIRQTAGDTPADAQVEVAHEALVRNWPRLVAWLDEERVGARSVATDCLCGAMGGSTESGSFGPAARRAPRRGAEIHRSH